MDFREKYSLIDPVPGEGTNSYQARQTSTGREVTVHVLVGGETPENESLLQRLRSLPPEAMAKLIEVGDTEGAKFVVTVAPPYLHLNAWLEEQEHDRPPASVPGTRAGIWKVPVMRAAPVAEPEPSAPLAPVAHEPGEFTKMFRTGAVASEAAAAPAVELQSAPAAPPPLADQPGEFTRMFLAAGVEPQPPAGPTAMPATSATSEAPPPAAAEPGEFTRLFQAPVPSPAPPASPVPAPSSAAPGEFTSLFQSPLPQAPAPDKWPAAQPKVSEPGEFTRMFQSPAAPPRPVPERGAQPASEFSKFFQTPAGAGPGPQLPSVSPFSAVLPQADPPAAPVAPSPLSGGGGATQAFAIPKTVPAPPASSLSEPSEYTRMMAVQNSPVPATGNPLAIPRAPQAGLPQMPVNPPMNFPQSPALQIPQGAGPAKAPPNMLLIGILVLLALLLVGIIVLLLVRH
jgi:hypothetical protein